MKKSGNITSFFAAAMLLLTSACSTTRQEFDYTYKLLPVSAHWETTPDDAMNAMVEKYKVRVDSAMSITIGQADQYMPIARPETELTNLTADMIFAEGKRIFDQPIDFAITNIGGIRNPMLQDDITLGHIFSIYSFDNRLTLIRLKGVEVQKLFDIIASRKGEAVSKEVRFTIDNDKATNITFTGQPLDPQRIYTIVTIDYVANGGDHMTPFLDAVERIDSAVLMRDAIIHYIQQETQAGRSITAGTKGRITVK